MRTRPVGTASLVHTLMMRVQSFQYDEGGYPYEVDVHRVAILRPLISIVSSPDSIGAGDRSAPTVARLLEVSSRSVKVVVGGMFAPSAGRLYFAG